MAAQPATGFRAKLSALWGIVGLLIILGTGVASAIYLAPSVVTDLQIRNPEQINGRIKSGKCSARAFVHICDATLSILTKDGPVERETHIAFFDIHLGDYSASVVADPNHPEWITTSLALDHLWNRVATLLVFWAVVLAVLVGAVRGLLGRRRAASA